MMVRLLAVILFALSFQVAEATPVPKQHEESTWFDRCQVGDWAQYSITRTDGLKGTEKLVIISKDGRTVIYSITGEMRSKNSAEGYEMKRSVPRRGPSEFSWIAVTRKGSRAALTGG